MKLIYQHRIFPGRKMSGLELRLSPGDTSKAEGVTRSTNLISP